MGLRTSVFHDCCAVKDCSFFGTSIEHIECFFEFPEVFEHADMIEQRLGMLNIIIRDILMAHASERNDRISQVIGHTLSVRSYASNTLLLSDKLPFK